MIPQIPEPTPSPAAPASPNPTGMIPQIPSMGERAAGMRPRTRGVARRDPKPQGTPPPCASSSQMLLLSPKSLPGPPSSPQTPQFGHSSSSSSARPRPAPSSCLSPRIFIFFPSSEIPPNPSLPFSQRSLAAREKPRRGREGRGGCGALAGLSCASERLRDREFLGCQVAGAGGNADGFPRQLMFLFSLCFLWNYYFFFFLGSYLGCFADTNSPVREGSLGP